MILTSTCSYSCMASVVLGTNTICGWIPKRKNNYKVDGISSVWLHYAKKKKKKKSLETLLIVLIELSGHVETHMTKNYNHLVAVLSKLREASSQYSSNWPGF